MRWGLGVLAASTLITIAFGVVPSLPFGYRAPALHIALETAAGLIALLAAFLVFGRLQREPRLCDLLLASGLAVLAVTNFGFRAVPAVVGDRSDRVIVWAAIGGRLFGAVLLAAAALASMRRLRDPRRAAVGGAVASLGMVAAALVAAWVLRSHLPPPVSARDLADLSADHPDLSVNPAFLVLQIVAALLYGVAAFGFARRAMRRNDDFFGWLALACVAAAFARINYFLYPSAYTDWVYLGDLFRLGFFALLLVAALREIVGYWRAAAAAAAMNERQRLARDLHDGLAQEVAFLRANIPALDADQDDGGLRVRLAAAADRAERESRQLLAAVASPTQENFDAVLSEAVAEVAAREQLHVDLDLAAGVRLDHLRAEALLRIAGEAVTNAARHAGVEEVRVTLEQLGSRVRLCVSDEGLGFEPRAGGPTQADGFGLTSMRGRARAIGAELTLVSRPGEGTEVEVIA
jgi:signal transduction histidine kinase